MKKILTLTLLLLSAAFAQPPANLNGIKLCIDPGHGGNNAANDRRVEPDAGNVFWESESNFRKALWLRPLLQARGATVFLTRETNDYPDDIDPTLTQRWQFANANNVHHFHSIHSNATGGTNTSTNYTMVLLKEDQLTRQPVFADAVTMSSLMYNNIRAKNRTTSSSGNIAGYPGVYKDYTFYGGTSGGFNLGVLNGLIMPGQLSEGSFHDYYPETRRLLNNHYRKGEAYALYNSFVEYYNIPYDTLGLIMGTQKNGTTPLNNIVVRLLPVNRVYNGDTYNNGFFFFDSLPPGSYKVVYETPGYAQDTVNVSFQAFGRVVQFAPAHASTGVPRNQTLTFTFTAPQDTAKVRTAFSITPSLSGVITWNPSFTVMTYTPAGLMPYKTAYTVSLANMGNTAQPTVFVDNKTVTAAAGLKNFTSTFTTISLPPTVSLTQPVQNDTNFNVASNIGIRFTGRMDTASVRAAFQISPSLTGTFTWTTLTEDISTLIWKPVTGTLAYQTYYTVTIGAGAKTVYGAALDGNKDTVAGDPFVLQFRTQRAPMSAEEGGAPLSFALAQNFPNPFNPVTTIAFSLGGRSAVSLKVYDVVGREVAVLAEGTMDAGRYTAAWDATGASSGMYVYKLVTERYTAVRRMMLVK